MGQRTCPYDFMPDKARIQKYKKTEGGEKMWRENGRKLSCSQQPDNEICNAILMMPRYGPTLLMDINYV